jgi:uncharacterized membrane protein YfcA
MYEILLMLVAVGAGFLGAILGLGGGIIVIPFLTLVFHVDIHYAIAASLVSIVATSSGAAASYLRDHLTNLRIGVFLEIGTVTGAIAGYLMANFVRSSSLFLVFGCFLLFSALMMLRQRSEHLAVKDHPWSKKLNFADSFPNEHGVSIAYKVARVPLGLSFMFLAGFLSALLGIGSGILKVLAMDSAMKLPLKVSSATSNFMIGVTATASAGAYFLRGDVRPEIAAPIALGIIVGSWFGARAMVKMPTRRIRQVFVVILSLISVQMIIRGLQG